tara:strand:+ start:298 stop:534 length:237 start_codon:yes stop_codon:yes gene_type:complete
MSLDILYGVSWWIIYKTSSGIYYIVYGHKKKNIDNNLMIENNNDCLDKILKIQEDNQIEIKKLSNEITILNNYIKSLN